ncbi:MAG: amidohydrolase family protein [Pseudomonadota bacterium]
MKRITTITAALCIAFSITAHADFAITNAQIHTMTDEGTLPSATVVVRDGRITAVGADIAIPEGVEVIDAQGRQITPGLFDPLSALGAMEVSLVEESVDTTHTGRYGAGFDLSSAINPRSSVVGVNRIEGVTRALVVPSAPYGGAHSVFAGRAAAVTFSVSPDETVVRRGAALIAYLGQRGGGLAGGSRAAAVQQLREALDDALDYAEHRDDFEEGERREYAATRIDLEALQPVISGGTPMVIFADRASDLHEVIRLKQDYDLRVIVAGGAEAWLVAEALAKHKIGVVLDPFENLPGSFDSLNATMKNAARLTEAGVTIAFAQGDSHNPRNLTQVAGNAVAHGLDRGTALRAITVNAAAMLNLNKRCCAVRKGNEADLVLWDGDPLETTTYADAVFVRGEKVSMHSRQTRLRDRYRTPTGDLPPAYRRP